MRLSRESSQRIRHERARLGWSLRTAARKAKVSVGTWQRLEKGEEVEYTSLVKVVIALGWPSTVADDLMRGDSPNEPACDGQGITLRAHARVAAAINADPGLSEESRRFLITMYERERARSRP